MAWRWAAAFVLMTSLVFATKLGLFGWDNGIDALDFRGPSGHATLSAFVWPMVAWALTLHASRRFRDAALFLGAAFALAVAWILVAFNFHSVPEVVAGSLLGGLASCICIRVGRFAMPPPKHVTVMAGLLVAILFGIQHGKHLPVLNQFKWKLHQLVTLDSAKGAHFRRSSG
jgi:multidrug transporter EmrE-like cation transporter